jgi:hypothetical protein
MARRHRVRWCPSDARLAAQADGRGRIELMPSDGGADPMPSDGVGWIAIDTSSIQSPMDHPMDRGSGLSDGVSARHRMPSGLHHHPMGPSGRHPMASSRWHRLDAIRCHRGDT